MRLEDTRNHAERAACTRAPLTTTVAAEKQGAMSHVEAAASVAAEDFMVVSVVEDLAAVVVAAAEAAEAGNRNFLTFALDQEIWN